jgi:hypothetical protein
MLALVVGKANKAERLGVAFAVPSNMVSVHTGCFVLPLLCHGLHGCLFSGGKILCTGDAS